MSPWGTSFVYCQDLWYVAARLQRETEAENGVEGGGQSVLYRTERWCKTDKRERRKNAIWAIVRHTKHNRFVKVWLIKLATRKTMQLSRSHLTSSVCLVDCSCLHLTLISESQSPSLRTTGNYVSADVRSFICENPWQTVLFAREFKLMDYLPINFQTVSLVSLPVIMKMIDCFFWDLRISSLGSCLFVATLRRCVSSFLQIKRQNWIKHCIVSK